MPGLNLFPDNFFSGTTANTDLATPPPTPNPDVEDAIAVATESVPEEGLGIALRSNKDTPLNEKIGKSLIAFSLGQRGGISALRGLTALRGGGGSDDVGKAALSISRVMDASDDILEVANKLTGDARKSVLSKGAVTLNKLMPGAGDALKTLSSQPDKGELIREHLPHSKILQDSLKIDDTGQAALKIFNSVEGQELLRKEAEVSKIPVIAQKLIGFKANLRNIVPKEMLDEIEKDQVITESELMQANAFIKQSSDPQLRKFALTNADLTVIGNNKDTTLASAGIATGKTEQDLLKQKAKPKFVPGTMVDIPTGKKGGREFLKGVRDPDGTLLPEFPHQKGFAILGEPFVKGSEPSEFPATTFRGKLPDGTKVQVTQGRGPNSGVRISPIEPDVKPEKKGLIERLESLKKAQNEGKDDKSGGTNADPPAARTIPAAVIQEHANNPKLKDTILGTEANEDGTVTVFNKDGKEVGKLRIKQVKAKEESED